MTPHCPTSSRPRIQVRGAGIIGLACALELVRRGARVSICDTGDPGRGASWAAAGLLGPAHEAAGQGNPVPAFLALCLKSAALWPGFATGLEEASGGTIGYRTAPALAIAGRGEPETALAGLAVRLARLDLPWRRLTGLQARSLEPALSPAIGQALELPTDMQVDNRAVVTALVKALAGFGVSVSRTAGEADILLETAGWSDEACHPVKGQMLSFAPFAGGPERVIRSGALYIVPKADRIIVGATEEPGIADTGTDEPALARLRSDAVQLCPGLADAVVLQSWAGLRPAAPDGLPVIGWRDRARSRFVATGHYRNGILLAPATAAIAADALLDGKDSVLLPAFAPDRFSARARLALDGQGCDT